jgi:hypothetical protein
LTKSLRQMKILRDHCGMPLRLFSRQSRKGHRPSEFLLSQRIAEADAARSAAEATPAEVYRIRVGNPAGLRRFVPPELGIPTRGCVALVSRC